MSSEQKDNRLFAVTGGGRGIGESVCRVLAASGLRTAVVDIDGQNAQRVAASLGQGHRAYTCDVSDEASVQTLFDEVEQQQGAIAGLVCVAGLLILPGGERPLIRDMTMQTWERSFAVNTRGAFLCSREYLRKREAQPVPHGRVIFFGSVAAQLGGYRASAAYIAAKAGLMGYAKAFARESAHLGITANCVAPGLIDTEMLHSTITSSGALSAAEQNIPLGRIGLPDDVAQAVRFLASREAQYITGSVVDVNGGYRMQ